MGKPTTTALVYTGPERKPGEIVALPEGWPAADHNEPDDELRAAKLASGHYKPGKE